MPDDQFDQSQMPMIPAGANILGAMMPSPLPPSSPVQGDSMLDPELQQQMVQASRMGQQEFGTQLGRSRAIGDVSTPLIQQTGEMPIPKMGFQPDFGGGVLHDIGQALLAVMAATGPGQAVQDVIYGPNIRRYQTAQSQKAAEIQRLQEQQKTEQEPLAPSAGMVYHPYMASASMARAGADVSRAASYGKQVQSAADFRDFLKGFEPQKLNETQRHNRVEEQLTGMGIQVQRERNSVILSLGDKRINVDASKFDAAVNNKTQGFFDQIFTGLGLKQFRGTGAETETLDITSPTAKQAGQTAKQAVTPKAQPKKGVVKWGRDAQGNPVRISQ